MRFKKCPAWNLLADRAVSCWSAVLSFKIAHRWAWLLSECAMHAPRHLSFVRRAVAKKLIPKGARIRTGGIQMTTTATYGTLSASEHSSQLRKAVIASTIGTAIEWSLSETQSG